MRIPSTQFYDGFGLVKGVDPVPWGRPRGSALFPWYVTWVTLLVAAVLFLVVLPVGMLTGERWLAFVAVALLPFFWVDAIGTTMIVFIRNRRKKRSKRS